MSIEWKGILTAVLLLCTIAAGIWLSRRGRPFSTGILTVHKLTALGMVVFAVLAVVCNYEKEVFHDAGVF